MKDFTKHFIWILLIPFLLFVSCKEESEVTTGTETYTVLTDYMVSSNLDLPAILDGWITGPPAAEADVDAFLAKYYVMDIRASDDYDKGHIEGAVNSTLAGIVDDAGTASLPVLVVCYTGQSASHAVVALRLSGYTDAKTLKWGMSGWNADFSGPWLANSGTENGVSAVGDPNWIDYAPKPLDAFESPKITSSSTDGATILKERVELMVANGFKGITNADVLSNPDNYYVNNYWAKTDMEHYGHINSAHGLFPLSIASGDFEKLDPAKEVVTYCWTGQTSSMITAYLTIVGFNAKSLKYGANGMIYTELESHKFVQPTVNLPVVTD